MVNDETTPKKRTRLFGGLAPKKASDHAAKAETGFDEGHLAEPDPTEPALPTTDAAAEPAVTAEQPAAAAETAVDEAALDAPAVDEPAVDDAAAAEPEQPAEPAFPVLKPESTTSLLFFAPPVSALPAGPVDDELDSDDEPSTSTRRRSRSRRGRGEHPVMAMPRASRPAPVTAAVRAAVVPPSRSPSRSASRARPASRPRSSAAAMVGMPVAVARS